MVLNLGRDKLLKGGSSEAIPQTRVLIPTGYRTPESGQTEVTGFFADTGADGDYHIIYTVTTGKTFFLTGIIIGGGGIDGNTVLATGAAASEVDFLGVAINVEERNVVINLTVPLKFTSATIISGKKSSASIDAFYTLIGFEE